MRALVQKDSTCRPSHPTHRFRLIRPIRPFHRTRRFPRTHPIHPIRRLHHAPVTQWRPCRCVRWTRARHLARRSHPKSKCRLSRNRPRQTVATAVRAPGERARLPRCLPARWRPLQARPSCHQARVHRRRPGRVSAQARPRQAQEAANSRRRAASRVRRCPSSLRASRARHRLRNRRPARVPPVGAARPARRRARGRSRVSSGSRGSSCRQSRGIIGVPARVPSTNC